ncbi:prepilin-type N-terminal cleavage/methylation domain-containing protein [Candidatus Nomurabacteria bacterium]|nr:prepilin-type N-terminal cleavage/methylation domain-containing protein [Candidatus Kaiserbacteria bacterium]MCB9814597.1 prepilin-type N-terminal cleavage/methylation domain-containing protein [Candidatus Nomurabacteria bacterium]
MKKINTIQSGFTLVEVIIVSAISVLIFVALFGSFHYSLQLINNYRAKLSALSVANDRMEYFRSLPYDSVGVVAGYPAGTVPQNSTTSLNGIDFSERVRIDYVDDPSDGIGAADTNGIILDYKRVRLEYVWEISGATSSIAIVSNIVPRSIESTLGGGTARINVLDADSSLLAGAAVRMFSSSSTFSYDVTNYTDSSGAALFNVPADSGYQVEVTASIAGKQYSTAKTYVATTSNPNPTVAPFAVLESDISTLTFQIGELSDLKLKTYSNLVSGSLVEEFLDMAGVASSTEVESDTNNLVLTNTLGVYDTAGIAYLNNVTPVTIFGWETVRVAVDLPTNTSHKVQFFTGVDGGPYTLIPDSALSGNTTGFTATIIDISELDEVSYPSIVVGVTLSTADTSVTPSLDEIGVYYRESATVMASAGLDIQGNKIIGTDASTQPIYKYANSVTTDGSGEVVLTDMEFDTYTITPVGSYDIASACTSHPIIHKAGIDTESEILLLANAVNTLRVEVVNSIGQTIPGIDVNLTRSGYNTSQETDVCGQSFFTGGLSDDSDYVLTVSGVGYITQIVNPFTVSGDTVMQIILAE